MTGHGIHHPKALGFFRQVFGTVGQQMPTADPVITLGAGKVRKLVQHPFCNFPEH
jgi:hypothetical protein